MITTKQFQILTDIDLVYKLMTEVYNHEETNGPAEPFFEYAITSPWLERDFLRLNRFWLDGDNPVAFVFYEQPVTSIYFVLRPGYEYLAREMIEYAEQNYPKFEDPMELVLISGQTALIDAAKALGYELAYEELPECRELLDSVPVNNQKVEGLRPLLNTVWSPSVLADLKADTTFFKLTWKHGFKKTVSGSETVYGHLVKDIVN